MSQPISLAINFERVTNKPLDNRFVFRDLATLDTYVNAKATVYQGLMASVSATNRCYLVTDTYAEREIPVSRNDYNQYIFVDEIKTTTLSATDFDLSGNFRMTGGSVVIAGGSTFTGNVTFGDNTSDTVTLKGGPLTLEAATAASAGIIFGTTGTANLYRPADDTLKTDDSFIIGTNLSVDGSITLGSDANDIMTIKAGPVTLENATAAADALQFGTGANLANLYRVSNDQLKTDDSFEVGTNLLVDGNTTLGDGASDNVTLKGGPLTLEAATAPSAGIIFGTTSTANLYRSANDTLKTDDNFVVGTNLTVDGTSTFTGTFTVNSTTITLGDANTDTVTINAGPIILANATAVGDALQFGSDANLANLYRSANDTLKTDDSFVVGTNLTVDGTSTFTGTFTVNSTTITLGDANTDTVTINAGPVNFPNATVAGDALVIGNDTNLYRSAADVLRTDDSLSVGGNAVFNSTNGYLALSGSFHNDEFEFINKLPARADLSGAANTPYLWFSNGGDSSAAMNCNQATVIFTPIWIQSNCEIMSGGVIAGTNATAIDVDVALYGCNKNGLPDARVFYANPTAASTSAGNVVVATPTPAGAGTPIKRGMYWAAVMSYNATAASLYQSVPSSLSITGGTNLRALHTGFDRILPRASGINNKVALETLLPVNTRLLTTFHGTGRIIDINGASTQGKYTSRVDAPFVFFVPTIYN